MLLFILLLIGGALWLLANYWLKMVYINDRLFWIGGGIVILFLTSFFFPGVFEPVRAAFLVFVLLIIADIVFLFAFRSAPIAKRIIAERMSNGDKNPVELIVKNTYPFTIRLKVIDELPFQFQSRNNFFESIYRAGEEKKISFFLRPVERRISFWEYHHLWKIIAWLCQQEVCCRRCRDGPCISFLFPNEKI